MLSEELAEANADTVTQEESSPSLPDEDNTLECSLDEPLTPILDDKPNDSSQPKAPSEAKSSTGKAQESENEESKEHLLSATGFSMGTAKVLTRNTQEELRELLILHKQLELTKLRLQLQTARTEQEVLKHRLEAMRETHQKTMKELLRKEQAGRKLVTLLIKCQSLNGVGPSKDVINSNLVKVIELLDRPEEIDLNMTDSFGRTAMHLLCTIAPTKPSLSSLRKLIARGQDIEVRSQCGKTGVHLCAETPNASALRILVKSGADVTVLSKSGISPTALEIAMTNLKFSSSEFRANSHVYADIVSSLTFWNIVQGVPLSKELFTKYGKIWAVNQAIRKGRRKANRVFDTARSQLLRWLKVFVLVDIVIAYVGLNRDFTTLPSLTRARSLRHSSVRAKLEKSDSDVRRSGSSRLRAKTFTRSSSGRI